MKFDPTKATNEELLDELIAQAKRQARCECRAGHCEPGVTHNYREADEAAERVLTLKSQILGVMEEYGL